MIGRDYFNFCFKTSGGVGVGARKMRSIVTRASAAFFLKARVCAFVDFLPFSPANHCLLRSCFVWSTGQGALTETGNCSPRTLPSLLQVSGTPPNPDQYESRYSAHTHSNYFLTISIWHVPYSTVSAPRCWSNQWGMGIFLHEPAVLKLHTSDHAQADGCTWVGIQGIPSNWVTLDFYQYISSLKEQLNEFDWVAPNRQGQP